MPRPDPRLPPGPSAGALIQTVTLHRDPLGALRAAQARYGDAFTIRLATARPLVVVAAPEEVRPLLNADPGEARAGTARRAILPLASPRSVWGGDGARHPIAREPLEAPFGREAVDRRRAGMAAIAERHAAAWPRGRPFRLLPRIRTLVDEVFVRLVPRVDDDRAAAMVAALRRMLWTPGNPPLSVPGEGDGLMGALARRAFDRRHAPLSRLIAEEVERRRARDDPGDDILGSLARADPSRTGAEVADELIVVLAAAQEPPAIALTRVLERVARSPTDEAAVATGGADRDAVVRETLRLMPAVLAGLRRLTVARDVAGHRLPAGTIVMLPFPLLHRDARAFPEPDEFRPERWADAAAASAAFAPFGAGARRCIGEHLSHAYSEAVVPAIVRCVRLGAIGSEPEPMVLRGTVLVPRRSALTVATLK